MALEDLLVLDKDSFEGYIKDHDGIVIFHKKLCPHCKVMGTVLEKVKAQLPNMNFASIDSEEQPDLMAKCGVERVPTLVVTKGGQVKTRKTGVMNPKETIAFYQSA